MQCRAALLEGPTTAAGFSELPHGRPPEPSFEIS